MWSAGVLLMGVQIGHPQVDTTSKRVNESTALGYVASRTVESLLILIGVLSLMSVVALRQDFGDTRSTAPLARGGCTPDCLS
jgi:hypothetical protein